VGVGDGVAVGAGGTGVAVAVGVAVWVGGMAVAVAVTVGVWRVGDVFVAPEIVAVSVCVGAGVDDVLLPTGKAPGEAIAVQATSNSASRMVDTA
jgi:hypothetical protein